MFTGIIMAIGSLEAITDKGDRLLRISCAWDCRTIDIGASIACSGICLTVVNTGDHWFEVAASAETMGVTTLGGWQVGASLNLERALRLGDDLVVLAVGDVDLLLPVLLRLVDLVEGVLHLARRVDVLQLELVDLDAELVVISHLA